MSHAKNARALAVELLVRIEEAGGYTNLLLDKTLAETDLSPADKRLCTQIVYGVTERRLTLAHIVAERTKKPPEPVIRCILYAGLYQLLWCDRIPDSAAVNESVRLCGAFRKKSAGGFVNAVLRGFLRDGKRYALPGDPLEAMQVQYSAPAALIQRLIAEHGEAEAKAFLEDSLLPPPLTVRLNTTRATADDLAPFGAKACPQAEGAYVLEAADAVHSEAFKKGLFHVQDLAPQICCALLGARPGETVLDVCAAPGGKSFTIAERMEDRGHVYAFDLYPQRVGLIRDGAQRLGLTCIRADVQDATQHRDDMPLADRILCDVPCSGFGVIRRKPEIKYTPLDQAAALPEIQYQILETAAQYLRPGGTLVYATCTVLRAENEDVVARFLASHLDFSLAPLTERGQTAGQMTFLPQHHGSDGFFAARLVRAEKEG